MFTGIIEEIGTVRAIEPRGEDARILIAARTVVSDARDGDSICVNGVCLTALEVKPDSFAADVSKETLFRSTLGGLQPGSAVNLERPVTPTSRLGGHIVLGHVDARGTFLRAENHGESWTFRFAYPKEIAPYLVFKGSVAVEGISLTIANLTDQYFEIAVIPKTFEGTNFSQLQPGDPVNLEADVLAKHLEKLAALNRKSPPATATTQQVAFGPSIISLVIMLGLIGVNLFLFRKAGTGYFQWYLKYGPLISLAAGFLGPTWTKMSARLGLISASPIIYLSSCLQIVGVFIESLIPAKNMNVTKRPDLPLNLGLDGRLPRMFDEFLYHILMLVMTIITLGWLVVVAPLAYFVTLIAAVPARQSLRGRISRTLIEEHRGRVDLVEAERLATPSASDLSFAGDPFAITQAMTALILWVTAFVYARLA